MSRVKLTSYLGVEIKLRKSVIKLSFLQREGNWSSELHASENTASNFTPSDRSHEGHIWNLLVFNIEKLTLNWTEKSVWP